MDKNRFFWQKYFFLIVDFLKKKKKTWWKYSVKSKFRVCSFCMCSLNSPEKYLWKLEIKSDFLVFLENTPCEQVLRQTFLLPNFVKIAGIRLICVYNKCVKNEIDRYGQYGWPPVWMSYHPTQMDSNQSDSFNNESRAQRHTGLQSLSNLNH